jgi:hypothetical protein
MLTSHALHTCVTDEHVQNTIAPRRATHSPTYLPHTHRNPPSHTHTRARYVMHSHVVGYAHTNTHTRNHNVLGSIFLKTRIDHFKQLFHSRHIRQPGVETCAYVSARTHKLAHFSAAWTGAEMLVLELSLKTHVCRLVSFCLRQNDILTAHETCESLTSRGRKSKFGAKAAAQHIHTHTHTDALGNRRIFRCN